jgi:hypothetical protein
MHNGRLANPLDPYVVELKKYTGKRKKTDEDLARIMELELRGGVYETDDGLMGLPVENVWSSFHEAAKAFKRGKDLERSLIPSTDVVPIHIQGELVSADEFVKNPDHCDYRSVVVSGRRVMRARPLVSDWEAIIEMELLTDVVDVEVLHPIIGRAGRVVGLGDFRPRYGTFDAEIIK